jgi:hypothetical protein
MEGLPGLNGLPGEKGGRGYDGLIKYFYKEVVKNAFLTTLKMNYTF